MGHDHVQYQDLRLVQFDVFYSLYAVMRNESQIDIFLLLEVIDENLTEFLIIVSDTDFNPFHFHIPPVFLP